MAERELTEKTDDDVQAYAEENEDARHDEEMLSIGVSDQQRQCDHNQHPGDDIKSQSHFSPCFPNIPSGLNKRTTIMIPKAIASL